MDILLIFGFFIAISSLVISIIKFFRLGKNNNNELHRNKSIKESPVRVGNYENRKVIRGDKVAGEKVGVDRVDTLAGATIVKDREVHFHTAQPQPTKEAREEPYLKISTGRLPYTGGAELFGREGELARLDAAWEKDSRTHVISLVAFGGVGKTALVKHWLAGMAAEGYRGAERVFEWSFYSHGTSGRQATAEVFIAEALKWFGDPDPAEGSPFDKGQRLADLGHADSGRCWSSTAWSRCSTRRARA